MVGFTQRRRWKCLGQWGCYLSHEVLLTRLLRDAEAKNNLIFYSARMPLNQPFQISFSIFVDLLRIKSWQNDWLTFFLFQCTWVHVKIALSGDCNRYYIFVFLCTYTFLWRKSSIRKQCTVKLQRLFDVAEQIVAEKLWLFSHK